MAVLAPIPKASVRIATAAKPGVLTQAAQAVTDVQEERIDERQTTLFAVAFFGLIDAPKAAQRGEARLLRRHASSQIFSLQHFQVRTQLFVELLLQPGLLKKSHETRQ